MSKKVAILLAPGFEEAEAIIIIDILRRLEIKLDILSCTTSKSVTSYHQVLLTCDDLLQNQTETLYDAIILPGGPNGTDHLSKSEIVIEFIKNHDNNKKLICPMCSAGAKVLAAHHLLGKRRYVCSGNLHLNYPEDGIYQDNPVVLDENILSAKGFGFTIDFVLDLFSYLTGNNQRAQDEALHIYYDHYSPLKMMN